METVDIDDGLACCDDAAVLPIVVIGEQLLTLGHPPIERLLQQRKKRVLQACDGARIGTPRAGGRDRNAPAALPQQRRRGAVGQDN
jgi:hypothetical protein